MKKVLFGLLFLVLIDSQMALAKSMDKKIRITTTSYKEIVVKDKKGKKITKWVKPTKVVPKDIIKYVNTIINDSNKTLENVKVINPINKNLEYIANSAKSKVAFKVKYSVDNAKSFHEAQKLFIKDKNSKKRLAKAKEYNAIEFIVPKVLPHSKVDISYKVKIK